MCVRTWRRVDVGVFFHCSPSHCLQLGLPSKLEHTGWLDWLAWSMKDVPVLSPSPVVTDQCMLPYLAFCEY